MQCDTKELSRQINILDTQPQINNLAELRHSGLDTQIIKDKEELKFMQTCRNVV